MPQDGQTSDMPRKVLIVDDSADDRALYRQLLGNKFNTIEAETMRQGLDMALNGDADCVLLDHMLPDGDGLQFIESMRGKMEYAPAIVMVTGRGSEETAAEAMKQGALDYLPKGNLTKSSITRAINNAVDKNDLQRESAQSRGKLEKSCRALSEFAHTASHDLKAPLRHIISYCEMLREDFEEKLGADGQRYISRLIVNSRRMQQLVDDLLAYSESRESAEKKEVFDFNVAFREAVEFLEENIRETGARVTAENLPTLTVYPLRVKRIFLNLISNALKYKGKDAPEIRVACNDMGDVYRCFVADNGIGIEPEFMEQIFEPFKRLHSRDEVEGSGLGLAITREIVEMHGGRLWAESAPGQGSTFYFTIPKA